MKNGGKENPVACGGLLPYEWLAKEEAQGALQNTKTVATIIACRAELDVMS